MDTNLGRILGLYAVNIIGIWLLGDNYNVIFHISLQHYTCLTSHILLNKKGSLHEMVNSSTNTQLNQHLI